MLVRNPPIDRLAMLIDYMSAIVPEVVIVDTGSTREELQAMASWNRHPFGTPKIVLLRREWRDDFAWARNEGLDAATRKWVLHLDPDELPTRLMVEHIARSAAQPDGSGGPDGWLYLARNYFNGIEEPFQEFHWHVRLFKRGSGRFYRALDELVSLRGLGEHETRGTNLLPKAPRGAYFIHSKAGVAIENAERLYDRMRADGKDKL